eukprot:CAMPEP_0178988518 /NCGR_PEP_ID=MMETSP0795-20121207/3852_1 /TAXON_ID=88552 /ORGANISM="Amoebophrya sp., Strain Ameob2" /LENGTH=270 /DNA_ID=CAMNT_0020679795 /DNA_START=190 /DNA_END=1002 /DNA_ORIENTATION=+
MADRARSEVTFSSVSSDDSLPLGCEHNEYFWIKRYRALKRRVSANKTLVSKQDSILEEEEEALEAPSGAQVQPRLRRLPCTRFYVETQQRNDGFCDFINHEFGLLGAAGGGAAAGADGGAATAPAAPAAGGANNKVAMLRTQDSLIVSAVSSRWFVVDVVRADKLLIGVAVATAGCSNLQPTNMESLKLIEIELAGPPDHGTHPGATTTTTSRVKLLVTPSVSEQSFGEFTVFVNDQKIAEKVTHSFPGADLFGVALWQGTLSDVKLVEY